MCHKLPLNKLTLVTLLAFLPIACSPELGYDSGKSKRKSHGHKRALIGAVGGAAAGGLLGAAIGSGSDNTGTGALVGAALGGVGGSVLGDVT